MNDEREILKTQLFSGTNTNLLRHLEDATDAEIAEHYKLWKKASEKHRAPRDVQPAINTCAVCEKNVWAGLKLCESHYKHLPMYHFFEGRDGSYYFKCNVCQDCCGCSEKRDYNVLRYCHACGKQYCTTHENSISDLCRECYDSLQLGKAVGKIFSQSARKDLSWEEFRGLLAAEILNKK